MEVNNPSPVRKGWGHGWSSLRRTPALAGWALIFLLAACGGGSNTTPTPEPTPTPTPKSNSRPQPTPRPPELPAPYPISVVAPAACVLEDSIYVTGGYGHRDTLKQAEFVARAYRYDPRANIWERLPDMPRSRCFHACVAAAGKLWLIGGITQVEGKPGDLTVAEVDCYDPATDRWTTPANMRTPRNRLAGAVVNDRVFVAGGLAADGDSALFEEFQLRVGIDAGPNQWSHRFPMPAPCHGLALAAVGETLVAVGGSGNVQGTWLYDMVENRWREGAKPPGPVAFASAVGYGGSIYLLGNRTQGDIPLLRYDVKADEWEQVSDKSIATHRASAVELGGKLYVIGGENPKGGELNRLSIYDLKTNEWKHSEE